MVLMSGAGVRGTSPVRTRPASGPAVSGSSLKHPGLAPGEYDKYVSDQRGETDRKALAGKGAQTPSQWVTKEQIQEVARYIVSNVSTRRGFALCHGSRSGREVSWFRESLPNEHTWGTELSPIAAATAPWTMAWDFHIERREWIGAADFVYSNALDHSYNPPHAMRRWMAQVAPEGALLIHWCEAMEAGSGNKIDRFRTKRNHIVKMGCSLGHVAVEVYDLSTTNVEPGTNYLVVVRHKEQPGGTLGCAGSESVACRQPPNVCA